MCRLMAYIGPPVLVADVVLWPDRSIIKQSYDARERIMDASLPSHLSHGNLNGDGFGIGAAQTIHQTCLISETIGALSHVHEDIES